MPRRRCALVGAMVLIVISTARPAYADPPPAWAHGVAPANSACGLEAVATAVDTSNGAVFSAFHQFDCGPNAPLLVGYSRSGTHRWTYGTATSDDIPVAVVVDPASHRVVLASTRNDNELLVQAFDGGDGHVVWSRGFTATGTANFQTVGVVVGHNAQVIATGTVTRAGRPEISVAALRIADGATRWHVHYDDNGDQAGATSYAIAADPANDRAYVLGSTSSGSGENPVTVAYDTRNGHVAWSKGIAAISAVPTAVVVDTSTHQVYSVASNRNTAEADTYAYSSAGTLKWTATYSTGGFEPYRLAVDSSNHQVYVAGVRDADAHSSVVAYSSAGARLWSDTDTTADGGRPRGVAVDTKNHRVYLTSETGQTTSASQAVTLADSAAGARAWRSVYAPSGRIAIPGGLSVDRAGGQVDLAAYQDLRAGGAISAETVAYPA